MGARRFLPRVTMDPPVMKTWIVRSLHQRAVAGEEAGQRSVEAATWAGLRQCRPVGHPAFGEEHRRFEPASPQTDAVMRGKSLTESATRATGVMCVEAKYASCSNRLTLASNLGQRSECAPIFSHRPSPLDGLNGGAIRFLAAAPLGMRDRGELPCDRVGAPATGPHVWGWPPADHPGCEPTSGAGLHSETNSAARCAGDGRARSAEAWNSSGWMASGRR